MRKILKVAAVGMVLMSAGFLFGCDDGGGMETEPIPREQLPQERENEPEPEQEETEEDADSMPELPGN